MHYTIEDRDLRQIDIFGSRNIRGFSSTFSMAGVLMVSNSAVRGESSPPRSHSNIAVANIDAAAQPTQAMRVHVG